MAVSIHKHYISSDAEDMERAAGYMLIQAKNHAGVVDEMYYYGAAAALYALAYHDLKTAEDFERVWLNWLDSKAEGQEEYE